MLYVVHEIGVRKLTLVHANATIYCIYIEIYNIIHVIMINIILLYDSVTYSTNYYLDYLPLKSIDFLNITEMCRK